MSRKIYAWIKEPQKKVRHVWISGSLENLQKLVGGYIEPLRIATDAVILMDEDAKLKKSAYNCNIMNIPIFGTIVFVGTNDSGEFTDFPCTDVKAMKLMFPQLWEVKP